MCVTRGEVPMPKSKRTLPEILTELHEALEGMGDLDVQLRSELRGAAEDIQEALDDSRAEELSDSLRDRVTGSLERFEGSHPRLTEIVGRVADALSDLGI